MLGRLVAARPSPTPARREAEALHEARPATRSKPWDWAFYAEKVRQAELRPRQPALRPYFELERVLRERRLLRRRRSSTASPSPSAPTCPRYHPDVRVFEVFDDDGSPLGPVPRSTSTPGDTKRGGAWMNTLVDQSRLLGHAPGRGQQPQRPQAAAGEPTLLTLDEVDHAVPRVRPRAARPVLRRRATRTSPGTARAARLRRVPVAGQRDVDALAGGPRELRQALRDRRADAGRSSSTGCWRRGDVQPGLRHAASTSRPRCSTRPGTRSTRERGRRVDGRRGVRGGGARATPACDSRPCPPRYRSTYFAHIFARRLQRRLLLLHLERGARRRHRRVVQRERRADAARTATLPPRLLSRRRLEGPAEAYRDFRGRDAEIEPLLERRGLL